MRSVRVITGLAIALLVVLLSEAAGAQSMSGAAIQAELSGKRVSLKCIDGTSGSGAYTMAKNFGLIRGSYSKPGSPASSDAGTVRASGNDLCLTFQKLNGGQERCFGVSRAGPGHFEFSVGPITACEVRTLR